MRVNQSAPWIRNGAIAAVGIVFSLAMPASAQWAWDGVSKKDTDAIVTIRTPKEPTTILLNGEPAKTFMDAPAGTVRVLIPSDASGISCENSFIVKFDGDRPGQLVANHCHGDTTFDVKPGEINYQRVTKEDVDNPNDDVADGNSIAFEWSANGFVEIDSALKWSGYSGRRGAMDAGMSFAIPETDAFFWITECKNGQAWNYIQMSRNNDRIGTQDFLQFETDTSELAGYYADIVALPFGDGDGTDPTVLLKLDPENALFADMMKGDWLYIQRGRGDDAVKRRLSLKGSTAAIRAFQSGCAAGRMGAAPKPAGPPLSAYRAKYLQDEVNGVSMLRHPLYRNGVYEVVSNKADRKWLFDDGVTMGPIEYRGGNAIIWACERHNCGNRNWTLVLPQDGQNAEVCFHETIGIVNRHVRYTVHGRRPMAADEKCER